MVLFKQPHEKILNNSAIHSAIPMEMAQRYDHSMCCNQSTLCLNDQSECGLINRSVGHPSSLIVDNQMESQNESHSSPFIQNQKTVTNASKILRFWNIFH